LKDAQRKEHLIFHWFDSSLKYNGDYHLKAFRSPIFSNQVDAENDTAQLIHPPDLISNILSIGSFSHE